MLHAGAMSARTTNIVVIVSNSQIVVGSSISSINGSCSIRNITINSKMIMVSSFSRGGVNGQLSQQHDRLVPPCGLAAASLDVHLKRQLLDHFR